MSLDRETARALMRHSDAVDLLLGAMSEIAKEAPDAVKDGMLDAIYRSADQIHRGVRAPILREYPELDRDRHD